ncbi:helix-turn-helix domain-containing protein [Pseudooctadecabacter sp.]|uniref:helix-turn-helix domain-containing protein n=1 Tax=Pseudooctadecabacter sp. TaxID=1966338 RepID=UPI0035C8403B
MEKTIWSTGHLALCQSLVGSRKHAGLGQKDLADRLDCHQSLVARIESVQRRIDVVEFIVLSRALGFDLTEVLAIVEAATEPDHKI